MSAAYVTATNKIRLTYTRPVRATSLTLGSMIVTLPTLTRRKNAAQAVPAASVIELTTQSQVTPGTHASTITYTGTGGLVADDTGDPVPAFTDFPCPSV